MDAVDGADEQEAALRTALAAAQEQAAALEADLARVVAAAQASDGDDEHDPEAGSTAFERSQARALAARARERAADLAEALRRHAAGTRGTCERCGAAIAPARLEARPGTRRCIDCARAG